MRFWGYVIFGRYKNGSCKDTLRARLLRFGGALRNAYICFGFERNKTVFLSETEEAAYLFSGLLIRCLDVCSSPEVFSKGKSGTLVFRTTVCGEDAEKLYDFAFPNGECRIDTKKFGCDHCAEAFIRGAFLSCGFVNPPEKRYGIEFTVSNADIAVELATVLAYKFGMPKLSVRKGNQIVYYRGGEKVADMLMLIGAQNEAFEIMNSQALRSIRNEQNRQTNFEVANISKQSAASAEQIEAITELKKSGNSGFCRLFCVRRQTFALKIRRLRWRCWESLKIRLCQSRRRAKGFLK